MIENNQEQYHEAITKFITEMTAKINNGVSFVSSEIPPVIDEILRWHFYKSVSEMVFGIVLLCLMIASNRFLYKKFKSLDDDDSYYSYKNESILYVSGLIINVCGGLVTFYYLFSFDWLKIMIAPKLYLIEYAATLIK